MAIPGAPTISFTNGSAYAQGIVSASATNNPTSWVWSWTSSANQTQSGETDVWWENVIMLNPGTYDVTVAGKNIFGTGASTTRSVTVTGQFNLTSDNTLSITESSGLDGLYQVLMTPTTAPRTNDAVRYQYGEIQNDQYFGFEVSEDLGWGYYDDPLDEAISYGPVPQRLIDKNNLIARVFVTRDGWSGWFRFPQVTPPITLVCRENYRNVGINWRLSKDKTTITQKIRSDDASGDVGRIDQSANKFTINASGPARYKILVSTRADNGTDRALTLQGLPQSGNDWQRIWTFVNTARCSERVLSGVWNGGPVTFTLNHSNTGAQINWFTIDWEKILDVDTDADANDDLTKPSRGRLDDDGRKRKRRRRPRKRKPKVRRFDRPLITWPGGRRLVTDDRTRMATARTPRTEIVEWITQTPTEKAANPKERSVKVYVERSGVDGVDLDDLTNETFQTYVDQWPEDGPRNKNGAAAAQDEWTLTGLVEGRRYYFYARKATAGYPCSEALVLDVPTTDFRGMVIEAVNNGTVVNAAVSIPNDYGPGVINDLGFSWTISMATSADATGTDVWETFNTALQTAVIQNVWPVSRTAKIDCTVSYGSTTKDLTQVTISVPPGPPLRAPRFNGFSSFSAGATGMMGTAKTTFTASYDASSGYSWFNGVSPSADVKITGSGQTREVTGMLQGQKYYTRWTNSALGNLLSEVRELTVPIENVPQAITPVRLAGDRRVYSPGPTNAPDEVIDNTKRVWDIDGSQVTANETLIPPETAEKIKVRYLMDGKLGAFSAELDYQASDEPVPTFSNSNLTVEGLGGVVFAKLDLDNFQGMLTLTWSLTEKSNIVTSGKYAGGFPAVEWTGVTQDGTVTVTDGTSTATQSVVRAVAPMGQRPAFDAVADQIWRSLLLTMGKQFAVGGVLYDGIQGITEKVQLFPGTDDAVTLELPVLELGWKQSHTIQLGDLVVVGTQTMQVVDRSWNDHAVIKIAVAPLSVAPQRRDGFVWPLG